MQIVIPNKVQYILDTLNGAGFEAYAVGGCVRDTLLGRSPGDWDITTSAKPEQVKALFRPTIDTGIKHGTVTVVLGGENFEITTYRIDGKYEDGRHPASVEFSASLTEDLKRRDFTVNAMAYHPSEGLIDLFDGERDLREGVIRCVGKAEERFNEDALRMLRAVRFAAQLDFEIEEETAAAIAANVGNLKKISAERIAKELSLLISSEHCGRIRQAYELGITGVVLPEFDIMMKTEQNHKHHIYSVGEHTIYTMEGIPYGDKTKNVLRWAALLHDVGKPEAKVTDENGIDHFHGHAEIGVELSGSILRRLKFDNDTISTVTRLVRYHDRAAGEDEVQMRHTIHKVGKDIVPLLFVLQKADIMAQSLYKREEKLNSLRKAAEVYETVLASEACIGIKDLALNGQDIMALGVPQGKKVGEILEKLLQIVLDDPELNSANTLKAKVMEWL